MSEDGTVFEVIKPGLETAVQDWPGRIGYLDQGFPASGPMDSWSFRLANRLVGNDPGVAALECQFAGPQLRFETAALIAVTGADMTPQIDGEPIATWRAISVQSGQTLTLSFAKTGARAYIALAGGIDTPEMLGSRATFHKAGVGGVDGHALKTGQRIPIGEPRADQAPGGFFDGATVPEDRRPVFSTDKSWQIEVVAGPNDDWISDEGHRRFLGFDWKLSAKSDRTGFRLDGPEWLFADKAINKPAEHGADPSNIIDQGYPCGAINLAGQTPIILVRDGPSMGGFINPYTVIDAALWKLGQARPAESLRFVTLTVDEAQERAREISRLCEADAIDVPG